MQSLVLILVASAVATAPDQGPTAEQKAKAALALAAASNTDQKGPGHLPYEKAYKEAIRTGKPIVAFVQLDCTGRCKDLRPDLLTTRMKELQGSDKPRTVLLVPYKGELYRCMTWDHLPTTDEVKVGAGYWKHNVKDLAEPPPPEPQQPQAFRFVPAAVCST